MGTGVLQASGALDISDVDDGEAAFQTAVTGAAGNLGSLDLAADGSYTYSVANEDVQSLGATGTHVDTFTIKALDGTSKEVSFTIHGVNDDAVIEDPTHASVTEDVGEVDGKLSATGTIGIEWEDVASLVSEQRFQVETQSGSVYLGSLVATEAAGGIRLASEEGTIDLPSNQIVRMTPIEGEWLDRLDGDVSAGYSLVSANNQKQFNFELGMEYQTEELLVVLNADATTTNSSNNPETRRGRVGLETYRLLPERWVVSSWKRCSCRPGA